MAIKIKCKTQDTLDIKQLTEFQGNLKERDAADYAKIEKSIRKHGFSFPFFVWHHGKINHVLDGHGRLGALQRMVASGEVIPPLPVVYVDCKNEAEAKEILLKLNSSYGKMTADSVREFLGDIEINIEDIALPEGILDLTVKIDDIDQDTTGDDDIPETDEKPVSKPGEMYELGNSILMCGDSTNPDDVARLMSGCKPDCVFSDPPYGMGLDTDFSSMKSKLEWQDKKAMGGNKYKQGHVDTFTPQMVKACLSLGAKEVFLWGADYYAELLENKNNGSWIVWDKRAGTDGDIEADESADKMYGSCFELCWSKAKHKRDIARVKWAGIFGTEKEFDHKRHHPTQKPIKLVEWFLTRYTKPSDIVVDLFGGSGSTLIAAEKNNRSARVMEIDPHYCDVIRKRWTAWAIENHREIGSGGLE